MFVPWWFAAVQLSKPELGDKTDSETDLWLKCER